MFEPEQISSILRSRGSTQRSAAEPLGAERFESVQLGNWICARTLVVLLVAAALRCWTILEQPKGSLMEMHPAFQEYLGLVNCWRAHINMSTYGGPTLKPTWLYSTRPMIDQLHSYRPLRLRNTNTEDPVEMVVHYTDGNGRARVKGGKHLKQSQSYPPGFLDFMDVFFIFEISPCPQSWCSICCPAFS